MALIKIFAERHRRVATCRSCRAPIVWVEVVDSGKKMPFDYPLVATALPETWGDERAVEQVNTAVSTPHFATCPDAGKLRGGRRGGKVVNP